MASTSCVARLLQLFAVAAVVTVLSACGSGGDGSGASGGGGGGSPTAPPAALSYPSPNVFQVGVPITPLTPSVTGSVSNYAISPSLPAGLTLSADTGTISGTPTTVTAGASYTVTASNSVGSTTFSIYITVNDANATTIPPSITYRTASSTLVKGVPVQGLTPINSGGAVVSWSVIPTLPAGLAFSSTDGSISGTPTAEAAPAVYVVTAENSGGRSSFNLTIAVGSVLIELGHATQIQSLKLSGSRVLSQDERGHWVLWDYATTAMIVSGDSECVPGASNCSAGYLPVDLAGPTVVIGTASGLEVRASADGRSLSKITAPVLWWKLSTDGSYIGAGSTTGLSAWTPSGTLLVSRPGDYSKAKGYAAPGEIRVALGAAGQSVVETISVTTGSSSVSPPFQGQFHSWFLDGERFLTNVSTTVWTYSRTGVQQDLTSLPTTERLTGQGRWFWTHKAYTVGHPLDIYAVGASAAPASSYTLGALWVPVPSGMKIGVLHYGDDLVTEIDLSGSSPSATDHAVPIAYLSAYAATSNSQWLVGNRFGVVLDGASSASAPSYFGFGAPLGIAGGNTRTAVATASGRIQYFDTQTRALEGTIGSFSSLLALSSDGSILVAGDDPLVQIQYRPDLSIKVLSLPSGSEIYKWPYAFDSQPTPFDFSLSGSGTALGQVLGTWNGSSWNLTRQVTAPTGGPLIWSDSLLSVAATDSSLAPIRLSPDGTLIAVSTGGPNPATATNIVKNGNLVTAVPGWALGWIDNRRLLVNTYVMDRRGVVYTGCSIYDGSGAKLASPPLPQLLDFQSVTTDSIYSAASNSILSLTTGAATWGPMPSTGIGAVSGSRIVFQSGPRVMSVPY